MPLNSWMDITTVIRYTEVYKQLLRYIFRSKDIESEKRPAIKEFVWWKGEQGGALGSMAEDEEGESDKEIEWIGRI
ncbi:hypothetical protein LARI1_G009142 [Lachnellula arida]|uniref:Uncharacterized protein n=1 Tax=Lachnellula arida TaxID=1316785 RepID=A0A8T9AXQ2_9HELO|nr:hypothetical protein LARI1_G009142 [Lachnellula arida]